MNPLLIIRGSILLAVICMLTPASPQAAGRSGSEGHAMAPDFTLRTMHGELFTLSQHLGKGPIVLNFWATWCLPCIAEMKSLKTIHDSRRDMGLQVLSLSVDDHKTAGKVRSHVKSRKIPFTILMDTQKQVFDAYHATSMPSLFLLDKDGRIVYRHMGYKNGDEKELIARLDALKD